MDRKYARVITEYKIEYSENHDFAWSADEIYHLLQVYEVNDIWQEDEYSNYCQWEIQDVDSFRECIGKLEELPPDEINEFFANRKDPQDKQYTNGEIAKTFRQWLQYEDKEDGCIRLDWI